MIHFCYFFYEENQTAPKKLRSAVERLNKSCVQNSCPTVELL